MDEKESMDTRIRNIEADIGSIKTTMNEILRFVSPKTKANQKRCFSSSKAGRSTSGFDLSKQVYLQEALRRNLSLFVNDLCLDGDILDRLYAGGCINSEDFQTIKSKKNENDKVRVLVLKLKNRAPRVINTFLQILAEDEAHEVLLSKFNDSLVRIQKEKRNRSKCAVCVMKENVDIKDIAGSLWEEILIPDDIIERLFINEDSSQTLRNSFWEYVAEMLKESEENMLKVIAALTQNYDYLVPFLKDDKGNMLLLDCCYCRHQRTNLHPRPKNVCSSIISNESNTSEREGGDNSGSFASVQSSICMAFSSVMNHDAEVTKRNTNVSSKHRLENRKKRINELNEKILETPFSEVAAMKFLEDKPAETCSNHMQTDTDTLSGSRPGRTSSGLFDVLRLRTLRPDNCYKCKQCRSRIETI
ncbi:uncharacterized protein LOC127868159 isoform X2 [Dreissena polymorpha]|uniref:CARD domain-containing protein n=1 Tax=Dreissena polymorpha TaxID=45954 RepID=A0A9D4M582_DREPO|nr:uncharacterized protein LOC127868159 isoform X2 [Dreissena polymorpha]KAH3870040.1 hypothetical protein DPMN_033219 [Dreissena polymorpha]